MLILPWRSKPAADERQRNVSNADQLSLAPNLWRGSLLPLGCEAAPAYP